VGRDQVSVVIADDQLHFAVALDAILSVDRRIAVVGRAENGREAVDLARELDPDVVLMDIAMPVMDGLEATREIGRESPETQVIMLTGSDSRQDVSRARTAGAAGYVTKDQISDDLVLAILRAVGRAG